MFVSFAIQSIPAKEHLRISTDIYEPSSAISVFGSEAGSLSFAGHQVVADYCNLFSTVLV